MSDLLSSADRHIVESWRDQRGLAPISVVNILIEIVDRLEVEIERLRQMDWTHVDEVVPEIDDLDTKTKLFLGDKETVDRVNAIADAFIQHGWHKDIYGRDHST